MDFSTLLSKAQKNENGKQPIACYQTKFPPPKKQSKERKSLSENIKKFLERKKEEERQIALEKKRKRENLLALRDHKAQSRINKHLKVCKAANKSVLADAVDNENTAVTIAGPSQPDEDDYGYVSQEASAFYNQLMNKYNATPQKPIFSSSGKKTIKDIASTKDRVKQALKQKEEEEALGHRRKRKSTSSKEGHQQEHDEKSERTENEKMSEHDKDTDKPNAKRKPMPPPMDFRELLKIAEKKQHEPVVIEVKPKNDEPERLMTKRQMKEYAKEKEWRERREQRERNEQMNKNTSKQTTSTNNNNNNTAIVTATTTAKTNSVTRIPKIGEKPNGTAQTKNTSASHVQQTAAIAKKPEKPTLAKSAPAAKTKSEKEEFLEMRRELEAEKLKIEKLKQEIEEKEKKLVLSQLKHGSEKAVRNKVAQKTILEKQLTKDKPAKLQDLSSAKPRDLPMAKAKPKQFPPPDLKPFKHKMSKDARRPIMNKRRIYDDEDEEEYDSELDDFIDDGIEEETEDYSKYISEIFGYDKSKYRNMDDEDDAAMESSFAQQLKEEHVSTKIGLMEDLEDMRLENLEKERKALMKKKMKK